MNTYKKISNTRQARKLALATAITMALIGVGSGGAMAEEMPQNEREARQESQIWTTYALSPYLRAHDIGVDVNDGKAVLTGKVDEEVSKELAKQLALGVAGIKDVDNQIVVVANYVAPKRSADRSYGEIVEDASITAAVKSKLLWSKHAQGLSANVETNYGKVTLHGTANSAAARELAALLALNTPGVVSVDNKLLVDETKSTVSETVKQKSDEAGQTFSDGWITTKVKSTLMYSSNVNSSNIAVTTTDGVVTLSGKVNSGAEHALAVELANNVSGVVRVEDKNLSHL
ncbi:MAG: BON domain-containing protein [Porticoccaceae bacterium]|nr:BON domain-containing protein [Porticoccaceae bacterium]